MSYPRCLVSLRVRVVHSLSDLTQCTCRIHVVWSHSEYMLYTVYSDLIQCTCRIHVVWSHSEYVYTYTVIHLVSPCCTQLISCTCRIHVVWSHSEYVLYTVYLISPNVHVVSTCLVSLRVRVVHSLSDLTQRTCRIHVVWSHSEYVLYTVYLISPNVHVVSTLSGLTQSTCCTQFI